MDGTVACWFARRPPNATECGLGIGPHALCVTDTRGHVVEDTGIAVGDAVTHTGAGQFPVCP